MSQIAGVALVFTASTCSSVGMNFQKLAHRHTEYEDPRAMAKKREQPLTSTVYLRPFMVLGFVLSIAAVVCDSLALMFVGTTTIGVLGCMSIPINVFVSKFLLYEEVKTTAKMYIVLITLGCLLCLFTTRTHEPIETFERFANSDTAIFIVSIWIVALGLAMFGKIAEKKEYQLLSFAVVSGMMGAQFVSMGKYLIDMIWLIQHNIKLPPTLQIIGVCTLFALSLPLQIIFLNKSLEKFNATHSVAIFQCTWCILNVVQGMVIFGDMRNAPTVELVIFVCGFLTTCLGIIGLAKQIEDAPPSCSDHSPSSTDF